MRSWPCLESSVPEYSQHALASSTGATLGNETYQGASAAGPYSHGAAVLQGGARKTDKKETSERAGELVREP